jgi:anti-anti-sigma factor
MLTDWSADTDSAEERAALELALRVTEDADGPVVGVDGGLVSGTADRLTAVIAELMEEGTAVTIDLTHLALLDSAGVGALLSTVDRAVRGSVDLRLVASEPAAQLLERTGVAAGIGDRARIIVR